MKNSAHIYVQIAAVCWLLAGGAHAVTPLGVVRAVYERRPDVHSVTFECTDGQVRLSLVAENIVRVTFTPPGVEMPSDNLYLDQNGPYGIVSYSWPNRPVCSLSASAGLYRLAAGTLTVEIDRNPVKLRFYDSGGKLLLAEKGGADGGMGFDGMAGRIVFALPDDEHFFGCGGRRRDNIPNIDKRGQRIVFKASELGETNQGGGFGVPFYYSTRGYGLYFDNYDETVSIDFNEDIKSVVIAGPVNPALPGRAMDYYFIHGPSFSRILEGYVSLCGPPILPEKWFLGLLMSTLNWGSPANIMDAARQFRNGGWPLDAIIEDYAWRDNGDVAWTDGYAAGMAAMFSCLDSLHVKLGLHVNTHNFIDATDMNAVENEWAKYESVIRDGADFWWQDQAEQARAHETNRLYGTLWAKMITERMAAQGKYVPVISRSGSIGGHRYIAPWPGDIGTDLEFLQTDLDFIRDGGLAGFIHIGADMGGFGGDRTDEVIMRRVVQMMLVFPTIRPHGAGSKPPWTVSPAAQELWRFYGRLRYRLLPYLYSASIEGHWGRRPMLAPLVFDNQDDPLTYHQPYTFMLGRNILVAPVVNKSETRELYLPSGTWIHYWTGERYAGSRSVVVDAPLLEKNGLPMFVKEGSIVAMMPEMNYIYEREPNPLTLDIYPPLDGGRTVDTLFDCETPVSEVSRTVISCERTGEGFKADISQSDVSYVLVVHVSANVLGVSHNDIPLMSASTIEEFEAQESGWYEGPGYFPGCDTLLTLNIRIPGGAGQSHSVTMNLADIGTRHQPLNRASRPLTIMFQGCRATFMLASGERAQNIRLMDLSGRLVHTRRLDSAQSHLRLGLSPGTGLRNAAQGIFLVTLQTDRGTKTATLIAVGPANR